jgi:hypothetical protein
MMYYGKKYFMNYTLHIYLFVGESNPMTGYSPSTRHAQLLST